MEETFSEFLKNRGHKEESLAPDRRAQLFSFFQMARTEEVTEPGQDADGTQVVKGDTVTLALVVTGVHHLSGDLGRGIPARTVLSLARVVDGVELHQFNVDASHVRKVT